MSNRKFTPNSYRVEGECAYVVLVGPGGVVVHEAIIDLAELDRVLALGRWSLVTPDTKQYMYARCYAQDMQLHRLILNAPDGVLVDHENRNGLDCRRSNLRLCSHAQNMQNRKVHKHSASGVRNVDWDASRSRWRVRVTANHKKHHIGYFVTIEEAAEAAHNARLTLLPFSTD